MIFDLKTQNQSMQAKQGWVVCLQVQKKLME